MIGRIGRMLTQPPAYYSGPVWMNKLGYQVARAAVMEATYRMRRRDVDPRVAADVETLDRDGYVVLEGLLSHDEIARARNHCHAVAARGGFKVEPNKDGYGADWVRGVILPEGEEGRWLVDRLTNDPRILAIAQAGARRKIHRKPRLIYHRMEVPPGGTHHDDRNCVLHADRHFPNIKCFIGLDDQTAENGAYIFAPGSHRLTFSRLLHEYEFSLREARTPGVDPNKNPNPPELVQYGRNIIAPAHVAAMGVRELQLLTPAGAAVISDNRGFHRRGNVEPGKVREQIRIVFQYLEEPVYTRVGISALAWANERGALPSRLQKSLRKRGVIM
jgi:hypothetical protein